MKNKVIDSQIQSGIFIVRGYKIMLSYQLAELYVVEPRVLMQAVKRNMSRFPADFMFQLTSSEFRSLKSQIVISSWGGSRTPPYAFTEQGVAMLSGVLHSRLAIQVNIRIMRVFVHLRKMIANHKEMAAKLIELERKIDSHDIEIRSIFDVLRQMMTPQGKPRKKIGFEVE